MRPRKLFLGKDWLRRLLPSWDYFCPQCKKPVEKNTHRCPHCGERFPFNFAIRAPPKLLRDKEALSVYVHKKIFPSLSETHRRYLTRYFTTFLEDSFEDGTFDAWTSSSGSPAVVSTGTPNSGTYHAEFNASSEYVYKTISSREVYTTAYVKWNTLPDYNYFIFLKHDNFSDPRIIAGAYIFQFDGVVHWGMQQNNGANYTNSSIATGAATNTYYRVKLWSKCSTGAGQYDGATRMWVDMGAGWVELTDLAQTAINTGSTTVHDTIVLGQMEPSTAITNWIDDVKIADVDEAPPVFPYIQQVSNVDSVADVGTHSDFTKQQAEADSDYDTLTEADTDTGTSQLGDTSGSGTSYRTTAANEMRLFSIQAANTGEVASIVFYGRGNAAAVNCKGIVTDSSGNLLTNGVGSAVSVSTTAGNKTLTFADPKPLVTAGTTYWFGVITAGAVRIYYDSTTGGSMKQDTTNSYTTPTSPTDAGNTTETWRVFYANITELNYQLQLEEQFTDIPAGDHGLQITTGAFSSPAETLYVQVWNAGGSTWTTLGSLTASTTNPLGNITSYISSGNLYIRFLSGTETNDNIQSTWQIDSVFLTNIYTKTFTLNAELAAGATTYTKTFTVGANLLQNLTKACTVNANLLQNLTKAFSTGGNLLAQYSKTFTVNGNLLANLTKTFTVNGGLLQSFTKTFTVNGNLLAEYLKTFSAGANLQGNYTVPFTVNANLLKALTAEFTYNGNLTGTLTKTFTYNAELLSGSTQTFTLNSNLTETNQSNFTYNALLQLAEVPVTETRQEGVYSKYEPPTNFMLLKLLLQYFESKP